MMNKEMVNIPFDRISYDGDQAWLLRVYNLEAKRNRNLWFPKSICTLDEDEMEVSIPFWMAKKEGLI